MNLIKKGIKGFNQIVSQVGGELGINESVSERNARHEREQQARTDQLAAVAQREYVQSVEDTRIKKEAEGYVTAAKLGKDQLAEMQRVKGLSEGKNLMSMHLAARAQEESEKQLRSVAYARGYNPMAARGVEMQSAEAGSNIRNIAAMEAEREKASALEDYSQMQQYQQEMALAGERAKKNLIMGNRELAEKEASSFANYRAALAEIDSRRKMADAARKNALVSAFVSGGAGVAATILTGGNVVAGAAAATTTNALISNRS
jgi:hypothetical protein